MPYALEGVRVLDMGNYLAGPYGPQLLGDLGAEVIKLEGVTGDPMRGPHEHPIYAFMGCQRGKRCIAVDLARYEGKEICYRLAAQSDIVHVNFRPGVAERLRVDYETLKQHNPRLIFINNVPF